MEEIKRIECFVPRRKAEGQFNSYGELTVYNRQAGKDRPATLFISNDDKPPKVLTAEDVCVLFDALKAKLISMREFAAQHFTPSAADRTSADLRSVETHINNILKEHGITL